MFEPTAKQQAILAALAELAAKRREVDTRADELITQARAADIPIEHIAKAADRARKTVYRHLGRPMK